MALMVDEDPEEARRAREAKERAKAKAEAEAAAAAGGVVAEKPKSKAQRDKERAEARAAARAKDEAAAKAKKEAAEAEARAAQEALKAEADALKAAAERKLKHESDVAKAALVAEGLELPEAMARLVGRAGSAEGACGGLLVLTQRHAAAGLMRPLLQAICEGGKLPSGDACAIDAADGALLGGWAMPLGWLVVRCDDLRTGQAELLRALEVVAAAHAPLLLALAPSLKALWEANVVSEEAISEWAKASAANVRRFAAPFLDWLRDTPATPPAEPQAAAVEVS
jgi:hypothetical protein